MYKTTVTYEDFNGEQQTEELHFHLSKRDVILMSTELPDGENNMVDFLTKVSKKQNTRELMNTFEMIISRSYGIKSEDGKQFKKSPEISEGFLASAAYDQFFLDLLTDATKAADFINGTVPNVPAEQVKILKMADKSVPVNPDVMSDISEKIEKAIAAKSNG